MNCKARWAWRNCANSITLLASRKRIKKIIKDALAQVPGVNSVTCLIRRRFRTFLAFNLPDENQAQKFQNVLAAEGDDTVCYKRNLWHYVPIGNTSWARSTANSKKYPFTDPTIKAK